MRGRMCRAYAVSKTSVRPSVCSSIRPFVHPSVRPCVTLVNCDYIVHHCGYFDTTRKGDHCSCMTRHQQWLVSDVPFIWTLRSKWPTPFETHRRRQVSANNASTVRDSEKGSIMTNRKSTTGIPTSYKRSTHVTPKSPKKRCFVFKK